MKKLESVAQTCNIRGVSSESVAEVKRKERLYYERFPLFRVRKKRKLTMKKNNINHL